MFLGDSSNNVFFPFQSVICSQPRPGGAELPPATGASETAEGSNGVEAMEQQPPENSSE